MTAFAAIVAGVFAIIASYGLYTIWIYYYHTSQARKLGCKPVFVRKSRLPLGIDLFLRDKEATVNHVLQNDEVAIYRELGCRATWSQSLLGTTFIVTVDPENIKSILATQFKNFELGHTRRGSYEPFIGKGIFTSDGAHWQASRALLRPQFSRSQISDLQLEETHVQNLLSVLPTQSDSWTAEVDLAPLFFHLTMDSATEFLFGESVSAQLGDRKAVSGLRNAASQKMNWSEFIEAFDRANMTATMRNRLMDIYYLYRPSSWSKDCKVVRQFADYYIQRALARSDQEKPASDHYIFLEELLKETRDPTVLQGQLLNILVAGRDTTAGLLGWTWYWLARRPAVFSSLRETVLETFGPYSSDISSITFEGLKGCQHLQHVLSEVLRLHPLVPENLRTAVRNTTLPRGGGPDGQAPIFVKAGQSILYNVHVMQRRKDIWGEDAEDFRPDRWVGYKPGWEFLPFNGGPRICIGQQFALTEAAYVVVRMLQRFDRVKNLDPDPIVKHRYTSTTSPYQLILQLHEAD